MGDRAKKYLAELEERNRKKRLLEEAAALRPSQKLIQIQKEKESGFVLHGEARQGGPTNEKRRRKKWDLSRSVHIKDSSGQDHRLLPKGWQESNEHEGLIAQERDKCTLEMKSVGDEVDVLEQQLVSMITQHCTEGDEGNEGSLENAEQPPLNLDGPVSLNELPNQLCEGLCVEDSSQAAVPVEAQAEHAKPGAEKGTPQWLLTQSDSHGRPGGIPHPLSQQLPGSEESATQDDQGSADSTAPSWLCEQLDTDEADRVKPLPSKETPLWLQPERSPGPAKLQQPVASSAVVEAQPPQNSAEGAPSWLQELQGASTNDRLGTADAGKRLHSAGGRPRTLIAIPGRRGSASRIRTPLLDGSAVIKSQS